MADIVLTIDPDDTSFALHDRTNGRRLMGFDAPVPETDSQWAFSADTEGERRANLRYRNRVITAQVLLDRSTAVLLEALENTLGQKVGKLAREGGELRFTYPTGTTITFNVLEASMNRVFDIADMAKFRARYEISFICEPFGLGTEVDMGDNTETTLPVLIFTETGILGDVPGLGRLVIDDDSAVSQWWLTWGIQSRYYSSSANAALFYEAEGRTGLNGSAVAVGFESPSGGGSNVMRASGLTNTYRAVLSTQATGGGAHLSHVGTFRVYARLWTTTADVFSVALEWSEGDFLASTINTPFVLDATAVEEQWVLADLGLVTLRQVASGTQRWEGRIIVKGVTADGGPGAGLDIDYLMFVPVNEGSGIASGVQRTSTPTAYVGEDHFSSTTAGNALNARVAPTGGTWATSGDATDFAFSDDFSKETIKRSIDPSTNGRFAILGSTNYTDCIVESLFLQDNTGEDPPNAVTSGVIARWTDSSNYLRAVAYRNSSTTAVTVEIRQVIAGVTTTLASASTLAIGSGAFADNWFKLRLTVRAGGQALVELLATGLYETPSVVYTGTPGTVIVSATVISSTLATGGTLATGKPGLFDIYLGSSGTINRYFDDFYVWVPSPDAALFASQSLEIRHDRVVREDSAGAIWSTVSSYQGDYLLVPPAGAEARTLRTIVKATRGEPGQFDNAIDDISARLFVTPRFLVVPDA
jgi:hypothetical protein